MDVMCIQHTVINTAVAVRPFRNERYPEPFGPIHPVQSARTASSSMP